MSDSNLEAQERVTYWKGIVSLQYLKIWLSWLMSMWSNFPNIGIIRVLEHLPWYKMLMAAVTFFMLVVMWYYNARRG